MLKLVQWMSPSFPTGAFAYAHGLEAAIDGGEVHDAGSLDIWLRGVLRFGAGWQDAVILAQVLEPGAVPEVLSTYARAAAPSAERWQETSELGAAFAKGVRAVGRDVPDAPMPVAVGLASSGLDLPPAQIIAHYLHAFAGNLVNAAVRFVPLGQSDGARVLDGLHDLIVDLSIQAEGASLDDATTASLGADMAALRHEEMDVRIFRT